MKRAQMSIGLFIGILLFSTSLTAEYVPFKVNLSMLERFIVLSLLPEKASFSDWKVINDLKDQLAPNEQERVAIEAKQNPNGSINAKWDAVPEKEIVFGEYTEKLIVEALKNLDAKGNLNINQLSLYRKFVLREIKE